MPNPKTCAELCWNTSCQNGAGMESVIQYDPAIFWILVLQCNQWSKKIRYHSLSPFCPSTGSLWKDFPSPFPLLNPFWTRGRSTHGGVVQKKATGLIRFERIVTPTPTKPSFTDEGQNIRGLKNGRLWKAEDDVHNKKNSERIEMPAPTACAKKNDCKKIAHSPLHGESMLTLLSEHFKKIMKNRPQPRGKIIQSSFSIVESNCNKKTYNNNE